MVITVTSQMIAGVSSNRRIWSGADGAWSREGVIDDGECAPAIPRV